MQFLIFQKKGTNPKYTYVAKEQKHYEGDVD